VLKRQAAVGGGALRRRAVLVLHWQAVVVVRRVRLQLSTLACGQSLAQCSTSARGCRLVQHPNKEKMRMRKGCRNRTARQSCLCTLMTRRQPTCEAYPPRCTASFQRPHLSSRHCVGGGEGDANVARTKLKARFVQEGGLLSCCTGVPACAQLWASARTARSSHRRARPLHTRP